MKISHKKALYFSLQVLRGEHRSLSYVQSTVPHDVRKHATERRQWVEPDHDPGRPYLNEAVFTDLVMKGYMETRTIIPGDVWIYRITPEGCEAIGESYPPLAPLILKFPRPQPHPFPYAESRHIDIKPTNRKLHLKHDPHRFRRSSEWRRN